MLEARNDGVPLEMAVAKSAEWGPLEQLVATGAQLSNTLADDPLAHVGQGYHRFRRYAPRMSRCLKLKAASVAQPLIAAAITFGRWRSCFTCGMPSDPVTSGSIIRDAMAISNRCWYRWQRRRRTQGLPFPLIRSFG
ncbi:hypothetical protein SAMN03080618_00604 [Aquamicrobium aerolatum DSM 21857]|uniref:Uncharacterized protein n=1 Tax=Aquamicrobium aerolatum DSM 21857 TaxID=1121003 RepID=A0A1I3IHQ5_9HYPH|nr:hypothetical protein SAMN03080618_00604 [Aquamicrobium aerolatum DSM 21857]